MVYFFRTEPTTLRLSPCFFQSTESIFCIMIRRGLPQVLTFALAITCAVATTDTTAATAASSVCTALKSSLGTTKVQTSGTQYTASAEGAWNVFNQQDSEFCLPYHLKFCPTLSGQSLKRVLLSRHRSNLYRIPRKCR